MKTIPTATPTTIRRPVPLCEAALNLPEGGSIMGFLGLLAATAIPKVAAGLPPGVVDSRGQFPEQWLRMQDATSTDAIVCVSRYSEAGFDEWAYRVPFIADKNGEPSCGDPVPISIEKMTVYVDVGEVTENVAPPAEDERPADVRLREAISDLQFANRTHGVALQQATKLLVEFSGKHELATKLGVALSEAYGR